MECCSSPTSILGAFGALPRFLGHYVRDQHLLPWEQALRRLLPCPLSDKTARSRIAEGRLLPRRSRSLIRRLFKTGTYLPESHTTIATGVKVCDMNGKLEYDRGNLTVERKLAEYCSAPGVRTRKSRLRRMKGVRQYPVTELQNSSRIIISYFRESAQRTVKSGNPTGAESLPKALRCCRVLRLALALFPKGSRHVSADTLAATAARSDARIRGRRLGLPGASQVLARVSAKLTISPISVFLENLSKKRQMEIACLTSRSLPEHPGGRRRGSGCTLTTGSHRDRWRCDEECNGKISCHVQGRCEV